MIDGFKEDQARELDKIARDATLYGLSFYETAPDGTIRAIPAETVLLKPEDDDE